MARLAVLAEDRRDEAAAFAARTGLPLVDRVDPAYEIYLVYSSQRVELREVGAKAPGPVYVDFLGGAVDHRRRFGGGRGQPLARAVGLKGGATPSVLDATAGLGRDAFVLATLGCDVTLVERSPIIVELLRDGLSRASASPEVSAAVARMHLVEADARTYMTDLPESQRPDVVYLDPMYPERLKSALVKKEMRYFSAVVGKDPDASELLATALRRARRRVVVKRPRQGMALAGPRPVGVIEGKTTRFDIYAVEKAVY